MNHLRYFVGKHCTILTRESAHTRHLQHMGNRPAIQGSSEYFFGLVEGMDEHGIWVKHILTGNKSYFFVEHVIAIVEEQVVPKDDPRAEKLKDKKEDKKEDDSFLPIKEIARLAKETKEKWEKMKFSVEEEQEQQERNT